MARNQTPSDVPWMTHSPRQSDASDCLARRQDRKARISTAGLVQQARPRTATCDDRIAKRASRQACAPQQDVRWAGKAGLGMRAGDVVGMLPAGWSMTKDS